MTRFIRSLAAATFAAFLATAVAQPVFADDSAVQPADPVPSSVSVQYNCITRSEKPYDRQAQIVFTLNPGSNEIDGWSVTYGGKTTLGGGFMADSTAPIVLNVNALLPFTYSYEADLKISDQKGSIIDGTFEVNDACASVSAPVDDYVVPPAPDFTDACGTANDGVTIQNSEKYIYTKLQADGFSGGDLQDGFNAYTGKVIVNPTFTYLFPGGTQTIWEYKFTDEPCPADTSTTTATTQPTDTTTEPTQPANESDAPASTIGGIDGPASAPTASDDSTTTPSTTLPTTTTTVASEASATQMLPSTGRNFVPWCIGALIAIAFGWKLVKIGNHRTV